MNKDEKRILNSLTIIYIEDDDAIRNNIAGTLALIFKKVITFDNAEDALFQYKSEKPDIILSDINLPNMGGIEFSQEIRKKDYNIPIILLSADTNKETLLEATKLRLVNYLVKPVIFEELYESFLFALKDILRQNNNLLIFSNNARYDCQSKSLHLNDKKINITSSENRLLEILIKNIGRTISSEEIKSLLWNDPYDATDSALKSVLSKLRSKIGKNSIKNVSGMGYYLIVNSNFN